jgi:hypothetical protein
VLRAKAGTEILATHRTETNGFGRVPLIVTKTYGAGKILFMGTDGAWRWRKGVEDKYHYRFWGRWCGGWPTSGICPRETRCALLFADRPNAGAVLTLNANVTSLSGEPMREGVVVAQITAPSGKTSRPSTAGRRGRLGAIHRRLHSGEPGQYRVRLTSADAGSELDTTISVQGTSKEKLGQPAKVEVLREIAQLTRDA